MLNSFRLVNENEPKPIWRDERKQYMEQRLEEVENNNG
jgi:hypothetical protein